MHSLKYKTLRLLLMSLLLFLGPIAFLEYGMLWSGFQKLEKEHLTQELSRVQLKITDDIQNTKIKLLDWARWDDLYDYLLTKESRFTRANLIPFSTLNNLRHELLVVLNEEDEIVNILENDATQRKAIFQDQEMLQLFTSKSPFWDKFITGIKTSHQAEGLVRVGEEFWIMAALPVVHTDGSGASRGSIVLGKRVTDNLIAKWAADLNMNFKMIPMENYPKNSEEALDQNSALEYESLEVIHGFVQVLDVFGSPAFGIKGRFSRSIMEQGRLAIQSTGLVILIATIVLGILIMKGLESTILSRISRLTTETASVSRRLRKLKRVSVNGNDEIATLSTAINKTLKRLDQRTTQIREIGEHVKFGIFLTDVQGVILKDYTKSCVEIFGRDIARQPVEAVFQFDSNFSMLMQLVYEQIRDHLVPADISLNQIPKRIFLNQKMLSISASPILNKSGKVRRILYSVTDATKEVEAEKESLEHRALVSILKARSAFIQFIIQSKSEFNWMRQNLGEVDQLGVKMKLHTLNGNLRSFVMLDLAALVQGIESMGTISDKEIKKIEIALRAWITKFQSITGIGWEQNSSKQIHEITEVTLAFLEGIYETHKQVPEAVKSGMKNFVTFARAKRLADVFAPLTTLTEEVSTKLNKKTVFLIQGGEYRVDPVRIRSVVDAMPHLIRNSLDHGIESASTRVSHDKPEVGTVSVAFEPLDGGLLKIIFSDDGQGIDPDHIAKTAVKKGLVTEERIRVMNLKEKIDLILLPGFTSQTEITEISGRGIGMAAVKELIEKDLKGVFSIESTVGVGSIIQMIVPVPVVELQSPQAAQEKNAA